MLLDGCRPVPHIFRKLLIFPTFASQMVCLYVELFMSYQALNVSERPKMSTRTPFWLPIWRPLRISPPKGEKLCLGHNSTIVKISCRSVAQSPRYLIRTEKREKELQRFNIGQNAYKHHVCQIITMNSCDSNNLLFNLNFRVCWQLCHLQQKWQRWVRHLWVELLFQHHG